MSDSWNKNSIPKSRTIIFGALVTMLFLGYLGHLFSLQIVDGYLYSVRAENVKRRSTIIPAMRGEIFDRHYTVPLATNTNSFAVEINPALIARGEHRRVFEDTAALLGISVQEIERKIPQSVYHVYQQIEIRPAVPFETIVCLAENIHDYPGVSWVTKPVRTYPEAQVTAHLLGYVGDITPDELQVLYNRGYTARSVLGKSGIEQQYDELLQGQEGRSIRTVDAVGRRVADHNVQIVPPEPGHNLVLTVDRRIQQLAHDALGERIGSVVVLKPGTGEILAMVSYPSFDPNQLYGSGAASHFSRLRNDARAPFLNRAIQSSYPPASTFKILLTTAVLEEGLISTDDTLFAGPHYRLGNRIVNEWRPSGFGRINVLQALANSSNVFFATIGHDYLGTERLLSYTSEFGFGIQSGIDLPGERPGLVPTPEWKRRVFNSPWVGGDTVNVAIGQGFLSVTPLQLANMVALLVNDGVLYRPHVLKEVRDGHTGEVIERTQPEIIQTLSLKPQTSHAVRRAMRGVVRGGTAEPVITTPVVEVAGKTGTAEIGSQTDDWHSWFAAYGPYETQDPDEQVVVVVMVDAANDWEWWAPKAANLIFHGIFADLDFEETVADLRQRRRLWYM
ncbi:MAG: penicillin-binding protein 2 [Spirochaetaceae bacterium]|nr:MAG: penicillin-binding protein 2 [Spirochaetaceae bacterium]